MEDKQRLELLKENYSIYRDNIWKLITFLVIFIGWLITSEEARHFIRDQQHPFSKWILTITLIITFIAHFLIVCTLYNRSSKMIKFLDQNKYYKIFEISLLMFSANIIAILMLYILATYLVHCQV